MAHLFSLNNAKLYYLDFLLYISLLAKMCTLLKLNTIYESIGVVDTANYYSFVKLKEAGEHILH